MRGFATFVVVVIVFILGVFLGAELGVIGKPNVITLEAEGTGVSPLYFKGDHIHWIDPYGTADAHGRPPSIANVKYDSNKPQPCKDPGSGGVCVIDGPPGNYVYSCMPQCGDPGTNVGGGGPTLVLPPPGGPGHLLTTFSLKALFDDFAHFFISEFYLDESSRGEPLKTTGSDTAGPAIPAAFITVSCDGQGSLTVDSSPTISRNSFVQWGSQLPLGSNFKVTDWAVDPEPSQDDDRDITTACGSPVLKSFSNARTQPCKIASNYPRMTLRYTIVDTNPTPVCKKAPPSGFSLKVDLSSPVHAAADTVTR